MANQTASLPSPHYVPYRRTCKGDSTSPAPLRLIPPPPLSIIGFVFSPPDWSILIQPSEVTRLVSFPKLALFGAFFGSWSCSARTSGCACAIGSLLLPATQPPKLTPCSSSARHPPPATCGSPPATLPAALAGHALSGFQVCRSHSVPVWATRSSVGQACLRAGFGHRQPSNVAARRTGIGFVLHKESTYIDVNSLRASVLWLIPNWLCLALFEKPPGPNRVLFSQSGVKLAVLRAVKLSPGHPMHSDGDRSEWRTNLAFPRDLHDPRSSGLVFGHGSGGGDSSG